MNYLIFLTLISCILNQVICDSFTDDTERQKKLLKYWFTRTSDYIDSFPKINLPDYYYCKKVLSTYKANDLTYSNSLSREFDTRKSDRLTKRYPNNNLLLEYKMNNYQEEMLPKLVTRKSDDPKIFRNLFLGSRG